MSHIGYIRVSTTIQNTDRQLDRVQMDKTFTDKLSGKDMVRPALQQCLEYLRGDDTLHVHSMDRLSRNLLDLEKLIKELTSRGVNVKFHKEGLEFVGGNEIPPMNKLMFQVMGAFAEFERTNIKERQAEGIAKAKEKGVYKGRKASIDRQPILDAYEGGMKKAEIVRQFGISRSHLYKILGDK